MAISHAARKKLSEALEVELDGIFRLDPGREALPRRACQRCFGEGEPCSGNWVKIDRFLATHVASCTQAVYSTNNPSSEFVQQETEKCLQAVRVFLRHASAPRVCVEYGGQVLSELEHHLTCLLLLYPFAPEDSTSKGPPASVPSSWKSNYHVEPTKDFWRYILKQLKLRYPERAIDFWEDPGVIKAMSGGYETADFNLLLQTDASLPPPHASCPLRAQIRPIAAPASMALRLQGRLVEALLLARAADTVQAVVLMLCLGRPRDAYVLHQSHIENLLGSGRDLPFESSLHPHQGKSSGGAHRLQTLLPAFEVRIRRAVSVLLGTALLLYKEEQYGKAVLFAGCCLGSPRRRMLTWTLTADASAAVACSGLPEFLHYSLQTAMLTSFAKPRDILPRACIRHRPVPSLRQLCCESIADTLAAPDDARAPDAYIEIERRQPKFVRRIMRLAAMRFAAQISLPVLGGALGRWLHRRGLHREALCAVRNVPLVDAYGGTQVLMIAASSHCMARVARTIEPMDTDSCIRVAQRARALGRPSEAFRIAVNYRQLQGDDRIWPLPLAAYCVRKLGKHLSEDELVELNNALEKVEKTAPRAAFVLRMALAAELLKKPKAPSMSTVLAILIPCVRQPYPTQPFVLQFRTGSETGKVSTPPANMAKRPLRHAAHLWYAAKQHAIRAAQPKATGRRGAAAAAGTDKIVEIVEPDPTADGDVALVDSETDDETRVDAQVVTLDPDLHLQMDLEFLLKDGLGPDAVCEADMRMKEETCRCELCAFNFFAAENLERRTALRYGALAHENICEALVACSPLPPIPWATLISSCQQKSQFQACMQLAAWRFYFDPCQSTLKQYQGAFERCYPAGDWKERQRRLVDYLAASPLVYNVSGTLLLLHMHGVRDDALLARLGDLDPEEKVPLMKAAGLAGYGGGAATAASAASATPASTATGASGATGKTAGSAPKATEKKEVGSGGKGKKR